MTNYGLCNFEEDFKSYWNTKHKSVLPEGQAVSNSCKPGLDIARADDTGAYSPHKAVWKYALPPVVKQPERETDHSSPSI